MKRLAIATLAVCAAPVMFGVLFVLFAMDVKPIEWEE